MTFKDGDTVVGAATVDASGVATASWTPAIEGQRVIRAEYSGAGNVNARPMPFPSASPRLHGGGVVRWHGRGHRKPRLPRRLVPSKSRPRPARH
ncbi:hypothetical protein GS531_20620 [Rhodococcus hoagii]|nr:hypothetical protein [Prescottella equi]